MKLHLDVVENDWLAGKQTVAFRLGFDRGRWSTEGDGAKWIPALGFSGGLPEISDEHAAKKILGRAAQSLSGTYFFATTPHAWGDCPYVNGAIGLHTIRNATSRPTTNKR